MVAGLFRKNGADRRHSPHVSHLGGWNSFLKADIREANMKLSSLAN